MSGSSNNGDPTCFMKNKTNLPLKANKASRLYSKVNKHTKTKVANNLYLCDLNRNDNNK